MPRFTEHNTEGYSKDDLDFLNDQFAREMRARADVVASMDDITRKSYEDHVAELILADFDANEEQVP